MSSLQQPLSRALSSSSTPVLPTARGGPCSISPCSPPGPAPGSTQAPQTHAQVENFRPLPKAPPVPFLWTLSSERVHLEVLASCLRQQPDTAEASTEVLCPDVLLQLSLSPCLLVAGGSCPLLPTSKPRPGPPLLLASQGLQHGSGSLKPGEEACPASSHGGSAAEVPLQE